MVQDLKLYDVCMLFNYIKCDHTGTIERIGFCPVVIKCDHTGTIERIGFCPVVPGRNDTGMLTFVCVPLLLSKIR
jgi:hypothetical protein